MWHVTMRSMCCRQGSLKSLALHHSHSLWYSDTRNLQWDCSTHPGPLQLGFCMGESSHLEVRTRPDLSSAYDLCFILTSGTLLQMLDQSAHHEQTLVLQPVLQRIAMPKYFLNKHDIHPRTSKGGEQPECASRWKILVIREEKWQKIHPSHPYL